MRVAILAALPIFADCLPVGFHFALQKLPHLFVLLRLLLPDESAAIDEFIVEGGAIEADLHFFVCGISDVQFSFVILGTELGFLEAVGVRPELNPLLWLGFGETKL